MKELFDEERRYEAMMDKVSLAHEEEEERREMQREYMRWHPDEEEGIMWED